MMPCNFVQLSAFFWFDDKQQRNEKLLKLIWRRLFLPALEVHAVIMKTKIFMKS